MISASYGETKFDSILDPQVVRQPCAQKMSFCATGMPVNDLRIAARAALIGSPGLGQAGFLAHGDERVEGRIQPLDAFQKRPGELQRWRASSRVKQVGRVP